MFKAFVTIDVIEDNFFLMSRSLNDVAEDKFFTSLHRDTYFLEIIFFVAMCELMAYSFCYCRHC